KLVTRSLHDALPIYCKPRFILNNNTMALEMKVPSPGESITEVEIASWLVKDGDYVEKDQAIAEVDSDKATLELPAEASGIITLRSEEHTSELQSREK